MGGRDPWASSTSLMIRASVVSSPIRVALMTIEPLRLIAPPVSGSPGDLSTGMDSPESIDSSTEVTPSTATPSEGMRAPGLMRRRSPTFTCTAGISRSSPSSILIAVSGASRMSSRIAPEARRRERPSRYFPSMMRATIIPAVSKYRWVNSLRAQSQSE